MSPPMADDKKSLESPLPEAASFALRKFAERQRVLNEEFKILERDIEDTLTILKKKKVKKFIDTINI